MITKQQAIEHHLNMIDTNETLSNAKQDLIAQIKALLPNVINSDNNLNINTLNDLLGLANTTSNNQGYELTFAGKGLAKAKADTPTTKELKIEAAQSKNFDTTDHVIIRGDNLDCLKILYKNYHHKIKMIYIDPPYNTKSENFVYNDNFKQTEAELIDSFGLNDDACDFLNNVYGTRSHSGWLAFMYPRLILAKELLSDEGVIFISIDDHEQANLKIICDEIFGEENFVVNAPAITNLKGNQDEYAFAGTHEYMFVYSKNKDTSKFYQFITNAYESDDWLEDNKGIYKKGRGLIADGEEKYRENRPDSYFPVLVKNNNIFHINQIEYEKIYIGNGQFDDAFIEELKTCYENKGYSFVLPHNKNDEKLRWTWGFKENQKFKTDIDEIIIHENNKGNITFYKKQRPELGDLPSKKPKSFFYKPQYSSGNGTAEHKNLFNNSIFKNPKPLELIKDFLKIGMSNNDLILDFFAGSGTTAHAVMQLNAEDGGNRKFILCQIDEPIKPGKSKPAYDFCLENGFEPVISSITIERINRAGEKIKNENPMFAGDIGYKVFSLTEKPRVNYDEKQHGESNFMIVNQRENPIDTLINMLVATCQTLDTKIEVIKQNVLYKANHQIYVIDKITADELQPFKDLKININAFADIALHDYLNLDLEFRENMTVIY